MTASLPKPSSLTDPNTESKTCLCCDKQKSHSTVCKGAETEIKLKSKVRFIKPYLDIQTKCQSPKEKEKVKESIWVSSIVENPGFYAPTSEILISK